MKNIIILTKLIFQERDTVFKPYTIKIFFQSTTYKTTRPHKACVL